MPGGSSFMVKKEHLRRWVKKNTRAAIRTSLLYFSQIFFFFLPASMLVLYGSLSGSYVHQAACWMYITGCFFFSLASVGDFYLLVDKALAERDLVNGLEYGTSSAMPLLSR